MFRHGYGVPRAAGEWRAGLWMGLRARRDMREYAYRWMTDLGKKFPSGLTSYTSTAPDPPWACKDKERTETSKVPYSLGEATYVRSGL